MDHLQRPCGSDVVGTYSGGVDIYNEKEDNFLHFRNDLKDTLTLVAIQ